MLALGTAVQKAWAAKVPSVWYVRSVLALSWSGHAAVCLCVMTVGSDWRQRTTLHACAVVRMLRLTRDFLFLEDRLALYMFTL
jgi:ABC-type sugar transport system substrate-binding protein